MKRIEDVYENRYLLPKKCVPAYMRAKKPELSNTELIGLEAILIEFIKGFNRSILGKIEGNCNSDEIRNYTRYNKNNVDLLDGCYNTFEFDGYLFSEIWLTDNDIPVLEAYEIPEDCEDWTTEDYADFETVLFRLD